jgi:hypothetical protein
VITPAADCLFINNTTDTCQHRDLMGVTCTGQCINYVTDGLESYAMTDDCECHNNSRKPACKCALKSVMQNERIRQKRNAHNGGLKPCLNL